MSEIATLSSPAARRYRAESDRAAAEQSDRFAVTLESALAVLRSARLDDTAARALAVEIATAALVELRTATDQQHSNAIEPVAGAFARLRNDLRPLVRFGGLEVQFVEPPANGRALPGEVAHAARAIVRSSVLALVDKGESRRVRIQWDCDGLNLLIGIRDDGAGSLNANDDALRPARERVSALDGELKVLSTEGWGTSVDIRLPLDPPAEPDFFDELVDVSPREHDVLMLVAAGSRNKAIAKQLGISDNTVKFHVSNLLHKAGVTNRSELAALAKRGPGA
jgi:DNA-binding CsgD family transcriptional regulator